MQYFITFFTHSGAIKFSRMLNKKNILNETSPVPRKLSSNCGIGVSLNYDEDIEELYIEDMERIYRKSDDKLHAMRQNAGLLLEVLY